MEVLTIVGVGGLIEKNMNGVDYILVQERHKEDAPTEQGLLEIPAGKIRAFENVFDCLRREIFEETGLEVTHIYGENGIKIKSNNYEVINYNPFTCCQNIKGDYPILVQIFICKARGDIKKETNESKNIRWISLDDLDWMLEHNPNDFYPMHIHTLNKYIRYKKEKLFNFKPMNKEYALEIGRWRYNGEFFKDIYVKPYLETYDEETNTSRGPGDCFGYAVFLHDEIVGIFEYYDVDDVMSIGLALNPKYIGKSLGVSFLKQGIKFGLKQFDYQKNSIKLTVNKNNDPAIHIYKKIGFKIVNSNNNEYEMILSLKYFKQEYIK